MKNLFILTICFLLFSTLSGLAQNELKDINTLEIYINKDLYTGERFLNDHDMVYTNLLELTKVTGTKYSVFNDEKGWTILIKYGDHSIPFNYGVIRENDKFYVPITTFCQTIGYELNYDSSSNVLDISDPVPVSNAQNTSSYSIPVNNVQNTGSYSVPVNNVQNTNSYISSYTYYPYGYPVDPYGYSANYPYGSSSGYSYGYSYGYPPGYSPGYPGGYPYRYCPSPYYRHNYGPPVYYYENSQYPYTYHQEGTYNNFGIRYNTCNNNLQVNFGINSYEETRRYFPYINSNNDF